MGQWWWGWGGSPTDAAKKGTDLQTMNGLSSAEVHSPLPNQDKDLKTNTNGLEQQLPWNDAWGAQRALILPEEAINRQLDLLHKQEEAMRSINYKNGSDLMTAQVLPYKVIIPKGPNGVKDSKIYLVLSIQTGSLSYGDSDKTTIKLDDFQLAFTSRVPGLQYIVTGYSIQTLMIWLTYGDVFAGTIEPQHSVYGPGKRNKSQWENTQEGVGRGPDLANFFLRFRDYNMSKVNTGLGLSINYGAASENKGNCISYPPFEENCDPGKLFPAACENSSKKRFGNGLRTVHQILRAREPSETVQSNMWPGGSTLSIFAIPNPLPGSTSSVDLGAETQNVLIWGESIIAKDSRSLYPGFAKAIVPRLLKDPATAIFIEKRPPISNQLNGPIASQLEQTTMGQTGLWSTMTNNGSINYDFRKERGFYWESTFDPDGNISVQASKFIYFREEGASIAPSRDHKNELQKMNPSCDWIFRRARSEYVHWTSLSTSNVSEAFSMKHASSWNFTWGFYAATNSTSPADPTKPVLCFSIRKYRLWLPLSHYKAKRTRQSMNLSIECACEKQGNDIKLSPKKPVIVFNPITDKDCDEEARRREINNIDQRKPAWEKQLTDSLNALKEIVQYKWPQGPIVVKDTQAWLDRSGCTIKNEDKALLKDNLQSVILRVDILPSPRISRVQVFKEPEKAATATVPTPNATPTQPSQSQPTNAVPKEEAGIKLQQSECILDWQYTPPSKWTPNARVAMQARARGRKNTGPNYLRYLEIQFRTKVKDGQLFCRDSQASTGTTNAAEAIVAKAERWKYSNEGGHLMVYKTQLKVTVKTLRGSAGYGVHIVPPENSPNGLLAIDDMTTIAIDLEGMLNGAGTYDMVAAESLAEERGDMLERMENRYNVTILAN